MASRSRHRSQDMGRPLTPGPQSSVLQLAEGRSTEAPADGSIFSGVDTTLSARAAASGQASDEGHDFAPVLPLLLDYDRRVLAIREAFNPLAPARIVPDLAEALRLVRAAVESLPAGDLRDVAVAEAADAEAALWSAGNLALEAAADDETLIPGQQFELEVSLWNGGEDAVAVHRLEPLLPAGWSAVAAEPLARDIAPGALLTRSFRITVAPDAPVSRPYFLHAERQGDLYQWPESAGGVGVPFEPPVLQAIAEVTIAGQEIATRVEGTFREVDSRQGESRRPVRLVPAVSVLLDPGIAAVPLNESTRAPLRFQVHLRSEAPEGLSGTLRLHAPPGWSADSASIPVRFTGPGEERTVELTVRSPDELLPGATTLSAEFMTQEGRAYEEGFELVDYPHVQPRPLYRAARVNVRAFPVEVPASFHVGYIPGAGDDAPAALRQLGIEVTELGAEQVASGDFGRFDAILTGIRAYEVNPHLIEHNRRLLAYAERGGTVVVQYNKYEYTDPGIAPFPVSMARPHGRVTDETAAVHLLEPSHQALSWPNRITDEDFQGWSQERGLYFLGEWDEHFIPLLELADPGEEPQRGSLLVARLGEGIYVYTGLAFFRQLPEGVPGAYRLLVNLLSLGTTP
jgi:hypothetical protein